MPRTRRIDFPGAFHHVYARGIEKRNIFSDDGDREELRRRIEFNVSRFRGTCLAWAFMPNHFHLLLHSCAGNLSSFMRCLMSGYAIYFNRRIGRVGHLFQNRYRSSLVDNEPYLLELIRYIHLNPYRGGVVSSMEELGDFKWTGHRDIVQTKRFPWNELAFVRDFFSNRQGGKEIDRYLGFIADGMKIGSAVVFPDGECKGDDLSSFPADCPPALQIPGDKQRLFNEIVRKTCRARGITVGRLMDGRRNRILTEVRKTILKACILDHGMSRKAVSSWLGITDAGGAYLLRGSVPEPARPTGGC